jgi:hypothetical protein
MADATSVPHSDIIESINSRPGSAPASCCRINQIAPLPLFNLAAGGFAAFDIGAPSVVFGHGDGRLWG